MSIFEGSAVALVLPMFDNGEIDYEGFKRQVQRMIDGGVQALLVNGTTGETATITIEEEFVLFDIVMEMAKGTNVKVICGAGSNDTSTALKKARYAKEKGADAILVVTPYYNKTSQRGLIQHYTTIADEVDIPMILYNVPGRTGLNIAVDTVVELAKHKNIKAMKDATDNIAYAMEVMTKTANLDFDMYSGCDDNILPFMAAGGKGVISVTSNIYPQQVEKLTQLILKGDLESARELAYALDPISRNLFIDVNPIMPKAALARMGVCGEQVRLPLIPTTDENKKKLFDAMDEFEKLGY
ncbi:MAG: 4-hydroxy-tetrahydrodipicolinate synthase [Faecalibacillus sp.]